MDYDRSRLSRRLSFDVVQLEEIYKLIAEIDSVKNSWFITSNILPQTLDRLMQSVIVTSTGASNRIEGNRLSDDQVEDLYRNLNIRKLKSRDEQEVAGYLEILLTLFENYQSMSLSESMIFGLHNETLKHSQKDVSHRGKYKFGSNRVEAKNPAGEVVGVIFDPTPPHLVQKEMQELLGWYDWSLVDEFKHPLLLIANFIFEYLAIHPFQDGNGRTSRLLSNIMLLQQDYQFTKIVSHERIIEQNKADYYLALNQSQKTWKTDGENIFPWILFFLKTIKTQSDEALHILSSDQTEDLLNDNQLALLKFASLQDKFTRGEAIAALKLPARTVEYSIQRLLTLKKIQRFGVGRSTYYRVS